MHLAPQTSAFFLAPRTHISRVNVRMKHLTAQTHAQTFFSAATRGSQEFTCSTPPQAVYTCAAAVCVSPCSLVISTQSGCTIWCTSDNESYYQWTSDCLLTPGIGIVTSAANPCGACNCQLGGVYDHDVEGHVFLSLFDHDLAKSVILDCPVDKN